MGKTKRAREQNAANSQAAQLQADASMQIAQMQSSTALDAARLSNRGSIHAATIMSGASNIAAGAALRGTKLSIEEMRRQHDLSVERLQPYQDLGDQFLGTVADAATTEGYAQRISDIMDTDVFADLQQNRMQAASSQLGQAGLSRSGAAARTASDITADVAIGLDDRIYGRQMNNVNVGGSAAALQSNQGANFANNAAQARSAGTAQAGGFIMQGAQQASSLYAQGSNAMAQGLNQAAYYSGQGISGAANAQAGALVGNANNNMQTAQNRTGAYITGATAIATMFMSDERLKENMQPIGKIEDLTLFEWDWKDYAKNVMGCEMQTGFKAQEVQIKYPNCVKELHGILVINYDKLYKKLEKVMNKPKRAADYKYGVAA